MLLPTAADIRQACHVVAQEENGYGDMEGEEGEQGEEDEESKNPPPGVIFNVEIGKADKGLMYVPHGC